MKTKKLLYPLMILSIILISASVFSQERSGRKEKKHEFQRERSENCVIDHETLIPDLTDDQKEQIKSIKLEGMKEIQPLENKIGEKEARLKTLTTEEPINYKEVDVTINEIYDLKATILQKQIRSRQKIKELLTEDQKIIFDKMPLTRGKMPPGKHRARR